MKCFKIWMRFIVPVFFLLGWSQVNAYKLMSYTWDTDQYPFIEIYFNPKFLSDSFAEGHPRLLGPLSLETRKKTQIQIFEEGLRKSAHVWSNVPKSTLMYVYKGLTDVPCSDFIEGAVIACFEPDHQYVATGGALIKTPYTIAEAGRIIFNPDSLPMKYTTPERPWVYLIATHELGHVHGLDHEEEVEAIMNSKISSPMRPLYEDDIAGQVHLYPFTEDCAPVIGFDEQGELGFTAQIYFDGVPYEGRLNYRDSGGLGSFMVATAVAYPDDLEKSCPVKVEVEEVDGEEIHKLHYPYIQLDGQLYWLDMEIQLDTMTFDVIDYQLAD